MICWSGTYWPTVLSAYTERDSEREMAVLAASDIKKNKTEWNPNQPNRSKRSIKCFVQKVADIWQFVPLLRVRLVMQLCSFFHRVQVARILPYLGRMRFQDLVLCIRSGNSRRFPGDQSKLITLIGIGEQLESWHNQRAPHVISWSDCKPGLWVFLEVMHQGTTHGRILRYLWMAPMPLHSLRSKKVIDRPLHWKDL